MKKIIILTALAALVLVGCADTGSLESNSHYLTRKASEEAALKRAIPECPERDKDENEITALPAIPLKVTQPFYPAEAQAKRLEGRVRVRFDVTANGRVDNVEILCSRPVGLFERETINAMSKWRYAKGMSASGKIINITFRLNGGASLDNTK